MPTYKWHGRTVTRILYMPLRDIVIYFLFQEFWQCQTNDKEKKQHPFDQYESIYGHKETGNDSADKGTDRMIMTFILLTMLGFAVPNILSSWYLFMRNLFIFVVIFQGVFFYSLYRVMVTHSMSLSGFTALFSAMNAVAWMVIQSSKSIIKSYEDSLYIANLRNFWSAGR